MWELLPMLFIMVSLITFNEAAEYDCGQIEGDMDYRGLQNKSVTGKTCVKWSEAPKEYYKYGDTNMKAEKIRDLVESGLGDHNYCRNPSKNKDYGLWCYVKKGAKSYEKCKDTSCADTKKVPAGSRETVNKVNCRGGAGRGGVCGKHGEWYDWCYTDIPKKNKWDYCCADKYPCGIKDWCWTLNNPNVGSQNWQYCKLNKPKPASFVCDGSKNWAKGGKASASSEYSSASSAAKAFEGPNKSWHSKDGMPQWIMSELNTPVPICKFSFSPRKNNKAGNTVKDCPQSYLFQGSNYQLGPFTTLFTVFDKEGRCSPNKAFTQSFVNENAFKFYRLVVLEVPGRDNGKKFLVVHDLKFFSTSQNERKYRPAKNPCMKGCPKITRPVCDSEGITHDNKCLFDMVACEAKSKGKHIFIVRNGTCADKPQWEILNMDWAKGAKFNASTFFNTNTFAAFGFIGRNRYWQSKEGMPQWLRCELKDPLPINKISWKTRIQPNMAASDCPKSFVFEGSNDAKTFTPLLTVEDLDVDNQCIPGRAMTKSFPNYKLFKYYRFLVKDVKGRPKRTGRPQQKFAVLSNLQFFVNKVTKPSCSGSWDGICKDGILTGCDMGDELRHIICWRQCSPGSKKRCVAKPQIPREGNEYIECTKGDHEYCANEGTASMECNKPEHCEGTGTFGSEMLERRNEVGGAGI